MSVKLQLVATESSTETAGGRYDYNVLFVFHRFLKSRGKHSPFKLNYVIYHSFPLYPFTSPEVVCKCKCIWAHANNLEQTGIENIRLNELSINKKTSKTLLICNTYR